MVNKLKEQMKDIKVFILNIIIVVMIFLLIIMGIFMVQEVADALDRGYKESSMMYRMEDESYDTLIRMYHTNEMIPVKASTEMREYYAVAQYYEAASYYKAFAETKDMTRAEKYQKRMREAAVEMGEFSFMQEKIHTALEIN